VPWHGPALTWAKPTGAVSVGDMTLASSPVELDDSFVRDLEGLYRPWRAATAPAPRQVLLNAALAADLGLDPDWLASDDGVALLVGNAVPEGATTVAQAYSGHQFGNYSPRLGDGRALLLGELHDAHGHRVDLHLKGSGRTPFARGGDGKAPLAPMLREYVISEAMHALHIPTTRSLAVTATGERVARQRGGEQGAVLARIAASHLRVGTFQYAAAQDARADEGQGGDLVRRLADHAIARHHPQAAGADDPYRALLEAVVEVQASLVAQWMCVGFVHGVMNTDNMTISGETIDYGPCAFLDAVDPAAVFSSIDETGRYAYGQQPRIAQWNLARFAESLLPLIDDDTDRAIAVATEIVSGFGLRFDEHWTRLMRAKLGLGADGDRDDDRELAAELGRLLATHHVDHTLFFRALSDALRGDPEPARSLVVDLAAIDAWLERWRARATASPEDLDAVNPVYVPRNHRVEEALAAAEQGDPAPLHRLLEVLARPFERREGLEDYEGPAPESFGAYTTFCGT
jgi:serine/tyrosine/threonine adenylyltransferase